MPREYDFDADRFAYGFGKMIGAIELAFEDEITKAVRKGCKEARDETKDHAEKGRTEWSEKYREGFTYKVKGRGLEVEGAVGNKAKPGLVHLLEKGHAQIDGGRTRAYPHLSLGYERGAETFETELSRGVDRALRR